MGANNLTFDRNRLLALWLTYLHVLCVRESLGGGTEVVLTSLRALAGGPVYVAILCRVEGALPTSLPYPG